MSLYLKMNRARFKSSLKNIEGDYVPWHLDDKSAAYAHTTKLGFKNPRSETFDRIEDALSGGVGKFVIKGAGGHSGKNVFILEKISDNTYLDLMAAKVWTAGEIKDTSAKRAASYWIREEYVESTVYGRPIPFDYKFDCFGDQIVAITQIDRNFWPPRVAIFDGAFVPMRPGEDYTLDPARWLQGAPVIPLQASKMIAMARALSVSTGTAYVRVDLFDGVDAPVFGEFTFASGPPDVGMVRFSERVIGKFDDALQQRSVSSVSGFDIDYRSFWKAAEQSVDRLSNQHPTVVGRIAASASFGDRRYWHQVSVAPAGRLGEHYKFCLAVATVMAGDEQLCFSVQEALRRSSGFINGKSLEQEFISRTLSYHDSRRKLGAWHVARLAEVMASRGDPRALDELKEVADSGYAYAKNVYARLTKQQS